ncbi:hypothetical protein [Bradyrhizobium australafricanum]|uniref:hypothetical protein n=1 Tax=Bradyrhizobium australafricanum TaxID=2821406 RepID=UPI001CE27A64|nr:hypothetical protein [Bradyrhizobium australafricanum]MCA6098183.1 hypothetical protein [Bradyrhizobium australafricanum]
MCEGLISVPFGAPDVSLVGLMSEPVPSDADLKSLKSADRVTISIPDLPTTVGQPLRMKGASLSGGRYFMAADLSDGKPRTWDVKHFRDHAALLSFDFVAFRPADQQKGADVVYVPVRLTLPSKPTGKGLRIRLLTARPFEGARATYLPLGADLKPELDKPETVLPSQTASLRQLVVSVPGETPSAFRLLVRTCLRKGDNCDLEKSTAATFDIVTSR